MTKEHLSIQSENILPIIKRWLYSEKEIFSRELVSNACDAIKKLKLLRDHEGIDVSDDELKLNIILKDGEKFDEAEFCTWMADQCIIAMVPRFIEIFDGWPMTATQKVKVAELKEITDKTWDRAKAGLKFSARK